LWTERLRTAGPETLIETGNLLTSTGKYEDCSFAILFAQRLAEFNSRRFDSAGIRNWAHTDVMCKMVLSSFVTSRLVDLDDLQTWRDSPAKFKRRAAAVTLVESIEARHTAEWIDFIEPLMDDTEKVVHQGVGWLLRELGKREPAVVETFLLKHKDTAPRLIYQHATEQMDAAGKARFRRKKKNPAARAAISVPPRDRSLAVPRERTLCPSRDPKGRALPRSKPRYRSLP
jgi:3-methyladenine DNA glycosylase AlkD